MKSAPSAESLFKTLKAENEPWLSDVFVSLPAFERLLEVDGSTVLYGDAGSGKTALRLALTEKRDEKIFPTLWQPEPILESPALGTALAQQAIKQTLRACVESLMLEGNLPQRLGKPSRPIASALLWLLQNYLPFDISLYIQMQANHLSQDESQWYLRLLKQPLSSVIKKEVSLKDQIHLLLMILRAAQYRQLWLIVDGLERWALLPVGKQVEALLEALLSTLIYFDLPGITFKFFVPVSFKSAFRKTSGVERHRIMEIELNWTAETLLTMVEKRLAYALSSKMASLASLCDEQQFLSWLKEYGGTSPRAWLKFTALLVSEYQKHNKRLTSAQTCDFILQHPAPLHVHHERREVWLGEKRITNCSTLEFRVLGYLATRPGKITSLEELYYYVYKELNGVPDKGEPTWIPQKTWRGAMDNVLLRIRQKIEPNPKNPIYLVTHHGKGVELLHTEM